jgi:hypothetical protein
VPPPPWHFAGDVLAVEFWNDPEMSVDTFPKDIELDVDAGHSIALFTDFQFTAQNDEHLDPARYQCREFKVLLDAIWKSSRIAWCPYSYADNDAAVLRGWIQGYPRKLGAVHLTRTFAGVSAASGPLAHNSEFGASLSAHGQLLARARVVLREKTNDLAGLLDRSVVGRRHFPRLSAGSHDEPVVDELVRCVPKNVQLTNIWMGEGALCFSEAYGEELEMLAPLRLGRGFRFSFSYSVSEIEILANWTVSPSST